MKKIHLAILTAVITLPVMAQETSNDFGLWTSVGTEYKINKRWKVEGEAEWRLRDNWGATDRWAVGLSAEYKILDWLKIQAGYKFIRNHGTGITYRDYDSDGELEEKNWYPYFWENKHRFQAGLTAGWKVNNWKFSWRERWQYTYRTSQTIDRYDIENSRWETKYRSAKAINKLRSKLQVEYSIPNTSLTPYLGVEAYTTDKLEKMRYSAGFDWKLNKKNTLSIGYLLQDYVNGDDDDFNTNALTVGYKFKF